MSGMYLEHVRGNTFCIMGWQLIPLYKIDDTHCILLDTGTYFIREELEALLKSEGLSVSGIICSHTHFDHLGNARYFQDVYHVPVAMPIGEAETCRTFASIKSYLFAYPAGQIMSDPKLAALTCRADILLEDDQEFLLMCNTRFRLLHTPGHSPDHVSIVTPDNVCYVGDALMCGKSLTTAKLPYAFNFAQSMESIEKFKETNYSSLIVSHCGIIGEDYQSLVDDNLSLMKQRLDYVCSLITEPMSGGHICATVKEEMNITTDTTEKAQNLERFVRPYLECLIDEHRIDLILYKDSLCYAPAK
ncbi:MAG: MBL fold metallo-hydrolase [Eubacterium sp.]|nr:MBL fold metallo-hydrolase [Eubacterium sp.]